MRKSRILLIVILILAAFLRIYNLGSNPPAAYGDEISFAWNAWNILWTGTDEYGTPYPLQFRAFDDYKAPIPVYLLVPFIKVLGLNTFAVRLPVVLFAIATIYVLYRLVRLILSEKVALFSSLLLTVSPWHMHLSRGFFEATIALFFFVSAVYFFIKAKEKINYLFISSIFFVFTLYTYFTPRIILIFFIPFLLFWTRDWIFKKRDKLIYFFLILIICSFPLIKNSFFDKGLSRINKLSQSRNEKIIASVTVTRNSVRSPLLVQKLLHNRGVYWIREVVNDYLEHFSVDFLYLNGDSSLRYFLGNMGMFYLVEFPFLILGFYMLYQEKRKVFWLLLGWWLIAPIPSALVGKPFAVRSLTLVPVPLIISAVSLVSFWSKISQKKLLSLVIKSGIIICFGVSFGYYLLRYHLEYPTYAATWWGWENKIAIDLALKEQNNYDQIFVSNFYTGADLALAYYKAYDPIEYKKAKENPVILADNRVQIKLGKFYIGSLDIDEKRPAEKIIPPKTLYIGRPEEALSGETINAPDDGRVLFKIYRTD